MIGFLVKELCFYELEYNLETGDDFHLV